MGRKEARDGAFKMLYQLDINSNNKEDALNAFFEEYNFTSADKSYITEIVNGVHDKIDEIDSILSSASKSWTLSRISKIEKAILRLAIYEIYFREDIPDSISIYEAVELSKMYDSPKAGGFVNGLLRGVLRKKEGENEN
ncbi:MAG: transcription antitermination factor NusB [Clostridia bacterium]|nr:transcription antitermination factor NusB [Clostridia bacterium]